MVPRSPRVQVSWGGQIPLSRPRLGGTPRSWWPLGCRLRSQLHPHPQEGRQHQALAPPGGEDNCQVIRFKFKIIKITIQNKKTNPCHKQTLKPATPAPSTHKKGHQQGLWGWQAGPARGVSSSLRGQRSGAEAVMSRGGGGAQGSGVGLGAGLSAAGSSGSLGFLCLGDVDRVSSRDLLHCFGRGLG